MDDRKYGVRNVSDMIREVEQLRQLIRAEGTPAVQNAWENVEQHIDYAYRFEISEKVEEITRNAVDEMVKKFGLKLIEEKVVKPLVGFRLHILQEAAKEAYRVCAETRHMVLAGKVEKAIMALHKEHRNEQEDQTFPRID